jgi:hypothetical protein
MGRISRDLDMSCYAHLQQEWSQYEKNPAIYHAQTVHDQRHSPLDTHECYLWQDERIDLAPAETYIVPTDVGGVVAGIRFDACLPIPGNVLFARYRKPVTMSRVCSKDQIGEVAIPVLNFGQLTSIESISNEGTELASFCLLNATFRDVHHKAITAAAHFHDDYMNFN